MARKFVSPGVFTQEVDRSFLAQGVASIGAAIVGTSLKGPAFAPLKVDRNNFFATFGDLDTRHMAPYAADLYFDSADSVTMVRVLGAKSYRNGTTNGSSLKPFAITASGTGETVAIICVEGVGSASFSGTASGTDCVINITGSAGSASYSASLNPANTNFIANVLNLNPTLMSTKNHFLYKWCQYATSSATAFALNGLAGTSASSSFDADFTTPQSPYVVSQKFGATSYQLFKFETISDGDAANSDIKIEIANARYDMYDSSSYGSFDVTVKDYRTDTVLSQWNGCTLNPNSANYIAKRIGNRYAQFNPTLKKVQYTGDFKQTNPYILVSMAPVTYPKNALPWGHEGINEIAHSGSALLDVPYVSHNSTNRTTMVSGAVNQNVVWGVDYFKINAGFENFNNDYTFSSTPPKWRFIPSGSNTVTGVAFSLAALSSSQSADTGTTYLTYSAGYTGTVPTKSSSFAFHVPVYGGYDGFNPTAAAPISMSVNVAATDIAVVSLKAGLDTLSNPDEIDMNLLAVPGVVNSNVTDYARQICNDRADCLFIMDIAGSSVSDAISQLGNRGIDDNYTATYYPDVRMTTAADQTLTVKPSVVVLAAIAYSDKVGQAWFAPAGLNRGGLTQFGVTSTADALNFQDRNDLYEARINPIAQFPQEGAVIFGQKTLQARPSALDRINVRRLLIYAKKTIASAARYLLFEPNNPNTWTKFLNTVNPILDDIRQKQGLERFKVVMDSTTNTADLIDRNIMSGKIFLQPTKAAEFIDLSFIITASGVSFEE